MRMMNPLRPLALIAAVLMTAGQAAADSKPLARYVPKDELIVYAELSGLDAHYDAWRKTATYKMLNETGAGAMLEETLAQTIDAALAQAPGEAKPSGKHVVAAIERWARSGFVVGVNGKLGPAPRIVEVFAGAGGGDVGKDVRGLLDLLTKATGPSEVVTREDGRKVTVSKSPQGQPNGTSTAWWFEGDDLVIVLPGTEENVQAIVDTIEGKRPSAVDNPTRAELTKVTSDGFEPVLVSFADLTGLPPTPPALGLAGLKRIEARWGFQGSSLVGITRVHAPSPRKGLLALLDGPTFEPSDKLPIPLGVKDYSIVSLDPGKFFDDVVAIAKQSDPNAEAEARQFLEAARNALGVPVREELLGQLGPKMAFYVIPQATTISVNPYASMAEWMLHPPQATAVVEVRDRAKFAKTLETLVEVANRQIAAALPNVPPGGEVKFVKLKDTGRDTVYALDVPLGTFPLPSGVRPTILLGERYLAFAVSPAAARKALEFERSKPLGPLPELKDLPAKLVAVNVSDPSAYMPDIVANIPFLIEAIAKLGGNGPSPSPISTLRLKLDPDAMPTADQLKGYITPGTLAVSVDDAGLTVTTRDSVPSFNPMTVSPVGVALLLPAVQAAREAARRAQSTNNLKQVMLADFNFESAQGRYPGNICDAEGKPLLSWRVAILPYLSEQALYDEFHLDEPWDSPHNKPLVDRMPQVFRSPKAGPKESATFYQAFVGPGAFYESPAKGTGIADVTDGTSNTIAVVEAAKSVPWSKPEDVPFDREKDVPKLGGLNWAGGFNAAFADGSVRFIKFSVNQDVLKALITKSGGEVISADSY